MSDVPEFNSLSNNTTEYRRAIHDKEHPYLQIRRETARDHSVSRSARALLFECLSHSEGWVVHPKQVAKTSKEGIKKTYKDLKELIDAGYCIRLVHREKLSNGKFGEQVFRYVFSDAKFTASQIALEGEEFKKFYRNGPFCHDGFCDHTKGHIKKEERKERTSIRKNDDDACMREDSIPKKPSDNVVVSFWNEEELKKLDEGAQKAVSKLSKPEQKALQKLFKWSWKKKPMDNPSAWVVKGIKEKWYENLPVQMTKVEDREKRTEAIISNRNQNKKLAVDVSNALKVRSDVFLSPLTDFLELRDSKGISQTLMYSEASKTFLGYLVSWLRKNGINPELVGIERE